MNKNKVIAVTQENIALEEIEFNVYDSKALSDFVQGDFSHTTLLREFVENGLLVYLNDRGKFLDHLQTTAIIVDDDLNTLDDIRGNFMIVAFDDEGEVRDINEDDKRLIREVFGYGDSRGVKAVRPEDEKEILICHASNKGMEEVESNLKMLEEMLGGEMTRFEL